MSKRQIIQACGVDGAHTPDVVEFVSQPVRGLDPVGKKDGHPEYYVQGKFFDVSDKHSNLIKKFFKQWDMLEKQNKAKQHSANRSPGALILHNAEKNYAEFSCDQYMVSDALCANMQRIDLLFKADWQLRAEQVIHDMRDLLNATQFFDNSPSFRDFTNADYNKIIEKKGPLGIKEKLKELVADSKTRIEGPSMFDAHSFNPETEKKMYEKIRKYILVRLEDRFKTYEGMATLAKKLQDSHFFYHYAKGDLPPSFRLMPSEMESFRELINVYFVVELKKYDFQAPSIYIQDYSPTASFVHDVALGIVSDMEVRESKNMSEFAKHLAEVKEAERLRNNQLRTAAKNAAKNAQKEKEAAAALDRQNTAAKEALEFATATEAKYYDGHLKNKLFNAMLTYDSGANASSVQACAHMATEVAGMIDRRPDRTNLETLGNILLSTNNLLALAEAYDVTKHVKNGFVIAPSDDATRLQKMYKEIGSVKSALDKMLKTDAGCMLLAALLLKPAQSKAYVNELKARTDALSEAKATFAKLPEVMRNLTDADIELFAADDELSNDKDFKALQSAKAALAKAEENTLAKVHDEVRTVLAGRLAGTIRVNAVKLSFNGHEAASAEKISPGVVSDLISLQRKRDAETWNAVAWEPSGEGEKPIKVYSELHSNTCFFTTKGKDKDDIAKKLEALKVTIAQRNANEQFETELLAHGFKMTDTGLMHPGYEIVADSSGAASANSIEEKRDAEIKRSHNLETALAEQQFAETAQQQVLKEALEAGIAIIDAHSTALGSDTIDSATIAFPITIDGKQLGDDKERPYLSLIDQRFIRNATSRKWASTPEVAAEIEAAPLDDVSVADSLGEAKIATLDPKRTPIIFDTCSLQALTATFESGDSERTYLDFLRFGRLTSNQQIIIPSVVAYLELLGEMPEHDKSGKFTSTTVVDKTRKNIEPFRRLLANASHARIEGGKMWIDKQGNAQNPILIVETEGDKELWDRIKAIQKETNGSHEALSKIREKIYGGDEGELAISRIAKQWLTPASPVIISDDIRYIKGIYSSPPPIQTDRGERVEVGSIYDYVNAMVRHPTVLKSQNSDKAIVGEFRKIMEDLRSLENRFYISAEHVLPEQRRGCAYFLTNLVANAATALKVSSPAPAPSGGGNYTPNNIVNTTTLHAPFEKHIALIM